MISPSRTVSQAESCCRANSSDGPVSAQPASARPPLSDELETVDGQAHSEVPSGGHVQQQGQPTAAVPTVNKTTAQQPALEPSVPGQAPAAPADVQSRTSRAPLGPVQPTAVSLVDGQGGASGSVQPAQEQEQPAAASADSQGQGQMLDTVPVQEPATVSSHQQGNDAPVSNAAKVEGAHSGQPAGSLQTVDATEAGGSVAKAAAAEAATAGSNLHQGIAGSLAAPAQCAALANGHSSAPQAAQAAAAISSALQAASHTASGRDAEPHASPAALTGALPSPADAQAEGEATDEGDTAAAAAHAQLLLQLQQQNQLPMLSV